MDAANMLKPALVRGDIRVIARPPAKNTPSGSKTDPALERRFQPVTIEELDAIQTWEVLWPAGHGSSAIHAVAIADDALRRRSS